MGKCKVIFKSRAEVNKWINISNIFAKSMISADNALVQFNKLTPAQRLEIKNSFSKYDQIRRRKIPKGEMDSAWALSVMVDAHIIATEFDVDPLTAVMCVDPICKVNEKIYGR